MLALLGSLRIWCGINIKICIVGRGFEAFKAELEREGKLQVVGAVVNLADWYRDAHFEIASIFDGSGMKNKVAEALMFGNKTIGTPEAFSSYKDVVKRACWCCDTVEDFMLAISCAKKVIKRSFDAELRQLYEELYSQSVAKLRLKRILTE